MTQEPETPTVRSRAERPQVWRRGPRKSVRSTMFACLSSWGGLTACGVAEEQKVHPLSNKTFVLQVATNNWTKPPMATQISNYIPELVIKFGQGSGTQMPYTLASARNGGQDPCGPTVLGVTTVEPFGLGPVELPLHLVHPEASPMLVANTTVHEFVLTNVIPQGATVADGSLVAVVDVREVYTLFTQIGGLGGNSSPENPDVVCNALKSHDGAHTSCQECAGLSTHAPAGPYCLSLQADYLSATETSMAIAPIKSDVLTKSACLAGPQGE